MPEWKATLDFSPDLYRRIADIARQRGISIDEAVKRLLDERLKLEPEPERPH